MSPGKGFYHNPNRIWVQMSRTPPHSPQSDCFYSDPNTQLSLISFLPFSSYLNSFPIEPQGTPDILHKIPHPNLSFVLALKPSQSKVWMTTKVPEFSLSLTSFRTNPVHRAPKTLVFPKSLILLPLTVYQVSHYLSGIGPTCQEDTPEW